MSYLAMLVVIMTATLLFAQLCQRIGLPAVLGQLLVGIILGPAGFTVIKGSHFVDEVAEIGVIFLMFIAGLESNLGLLKRYLKPASFVAILGVILPLGAFYAVSQFLGWSVEEACFLGVLFAATSVSISVEVLKELHHLDTKEGATILGAAVLDDILAVLLLSGLVAAFGNLSGEGHGRNLALTIGLQAAFFVAVFALVKWGLPYLVRFSKKMTVAHADIIIAVISCLAMAYLAETCGLSDVVGAFFAGVGLAQSPLKKSLVPQVEAIGYAVFIPVFFANIGLQMEFSGIFAQLGLILGLSSLAVLTKWLGCGLGAKLAGFSQASSSVVGAGMVSRGEMALIIAEIGYGAHLLNKTYYSTMIVVIIITTLVAPLMLKTSVNHLKQA